MRMGEGVEWALHCAVVLALAPAGATVPAARLAEFHGVPPAYLAKHLQAMSRAGIVESVPGPRGGYRLAGPPARISVLDVVLAVDGAGAAFVCTEIRRRGPAAAAPAAYQVPCTVARTMAEAEASWRSVLGRRSIADLAGDVARTVDPEAARKAAAWLQEAMR